MWPINGRDSFVGRGRLQLVRTGQQTKQIKFTVDFSFLLFFLLCNIFYHKFSKNFIVLVLILYMTCDLDHYFVIYSKCGRRFPSVGSLHVGVLLNSYLCKYFDGGLIISQLRTLTFFNSQICICQWEDHANPTPAKWFVDRFRSNWWSYAIFKYYRMQFVTQAQTLFLEDSVGYF